MNAVFCGLAAGNTDQPGGGARKFEAPSYCHSLPTSDGKPATSVGLLIIAPDDYAVAVVAVALESIEPQHDEHP